MEQPQGNPISLGKAAKKYGVNVMTLSHWAESGRITILQRPEKKGQPLLVDEASVIIAREAFTPTWRRGAPRQFPMDVIPQAPAPDLPQAPALQPASSQRKTLELVTEYLDYGRSVGFAANTLMQLTTMLSRFAEACPELPLTPEPVFDFYNALPTSQTTKRAYFSRIKMFYNWLYERHDLTPPRFKKSMNPRVTKRAPKVLTAEEKDKLLSVISDRQDKLMINLILATGIRSTAACNLTDQDVHQDHITIRAVEGSKTGEQEVPIPPWIYNQLKMQGTGFLFLNSRGKQMTRYALYSRVETYMIAAGITGDKLGAHTLRHTAAVELHEATGDLDLVRQVLGHTRVQTTQIYARLRPSKVQEKYQALSPMRNAPGEPGLQGSLDLEAA